MECLYPAAAPGFSCLTCIAWLVGWLERQQNPSMNWWISLSLKPTTGAPPVRFVQVSARPKRFCKNEPKVPSGSSPQLADPLQFASACCGSELTVKRLELLKEGVLAARFVVSRRALKEHAGTVG